MTASPTSAASPAPPPLPVNRRSERAAATWLAGTGAVAVIGLVSFFATPYLVRWLGDAQWGAWEVIGEWLGYLGILHLALGPGALNIFFLRAHTSGEPDALAAMAKRGLRMYFWVYALIPVALLLAWFAPRMLHAPAALDADVRWAVGIAAVGSLLLAPLGIARGVLETVQRGYLVRAALLLQSLLIFALALWWTWLRWGLVGMAAASMVGTGAGMAIWGWLARPFLRGWKATAPAAVSTREIWHFNWPLIVAMLGNQINALTDNTVVAAMLGSAAVASFALTQSLLLLAGARFHDVGNSSWAALGELRARNPEAFSQRVTELSATVLGASLVLMSTLAAFNQPFVTLWVGAHHFAGVVLSWATAAGMAVFALICFFSWLISTQGDTQRKLWVSTLGAALNLGLSLVLIRWWGVAGVAVGTLVAYLATDAWFLPFLCVRQYQIPGRELVRALFAALGRGLIWAAGMGLLTVWLAPAAAWPLLLAEMIPAGGLALLYCWWVILRPADRSAWRGRWLAMRTRATG